MSSSGDEAAYSCSQHLAEDSTAAALTRLEMAIVRSAAAFARWAPELHKLISGLQMSFQDAAILHCIRLRGGSTTLAEMMLFLNRNDLAAVQYSLRKLEKSGLVRKAKGPQRREIYYSITERAQEQTTAYSKKRHAVLVSLFKDVTGLEAGLEQAAAVLERIPGIYDQATQVVLNQALLAVSAEREDRLAARESVAAGRDAATPEHPDRD